MSTMLLSLLAGLLVSCTPLPFAEGVSLGAPLACPSEWLAVGPTDCVRIVETPSNITKARQYCLSLGNGSKLVLLRNSRFNQKLTATLIAAATKMNYNGTISFWTGASVVNNGLRWLDADYTDLSMSQLPGMTPALSRFNGKYGSLQLTVENQQLQLSFIDGSEKQLSLCARQPLESPFQPSVPLDKQLRCPGFNATLHGNLCYKVLNSPDLANARWNRDGALAACRNWSREASLAVVNDFNTEFLATALISAEALGHTWIGLEYQDGKYWAWHDNNTEMRHSVWKSNEPSRPFEQEACVVAHQREASLGEWNNVPCADRFPSVLCQAPASKDIKGAAPLTIGVNQDASGHRCALGFYAFEDACWLLDAHVNGTRAEILAECASRNGSTLALFHHRGEQAFISALADQLGIVSPDTDASVWLGLNVTVDDHGTLLTWFDGSSADYDYVWKQLPSQVIKDAADDAGQLCTSLVLKSNSLEARLCYDTNPMMACRYTLVEHPMSPNKSQELFCPDANTPAINGKCFKFVSANADWEEALTGCQKLHGNGSLASIHSRQELLYLAELLKSADSAWIGLTVRNSELQQHLSWSDSTSAQFFQFRHNNPKLPLNMSETEKMCVLMKQKYGEWTTEVCTEKHSFICQVPGVLSTTSTKTSTATTTTTTSTTIKTSTASTTSPSSTAAPSTSSPQTTASSSNGSNCSLSEVSGNMSMSMAIPGGCVDYAFLASEAVWHEAKSKCQVILPDSEPASITSLAELNATLNFLYKFKLVELVWLGASTESSSVANAFSIWSDGTAMRFVNFAPLENPPDQTVRLAGPLCVSMDARNSSKYPGRFITMTCNAQLPILCKRIRNFKIPIKTSSSSNSLSATTHTCPVGWVSASSEDAACYRLLKDRAGAFKKAEEACANAGARLASFQTRRQLQRMASLLSISEASSAWIGLSLSENADNGTYIWSDKSSLESVDWATFTAVERFDCVRLSSSPYWWLSGHLSTSPCSTHLPPLCRLKGNQSSGAVAASVGCPPGFVIFNANCYYTSVAAANYADASIACRNKSAVLLELADSGEAAAELHYLRSALIPLQSSDTANASVWLGLQRSPVSCRSADCSWTWRSSNRPVRSDLLYPASALGRLNLASDSSECFALSIGWGLLAAKACTDLLPYVCKLPAQLPSQLKTTTTTALDEADANCNRDRKLVSTGADGQVCARWDVALAISQSAGGRGAFATAAAADLAVNLTAATFAKLDNETVGSAAAYCRNVAGVGKKYVCFASGTLGHQLQIVDCRIPTCPTSSASAAYSSVSVALAVVLALCSAAALAGLAVIGFRLWSRSRWASGYRPQLNLDATTGLTPRGGLGGTSFHNPIYMPANC